MGGSDRPAYDENPGANKRIYNLFDIIYSVFQFILYVPESKVSFYAPGTAAFALLGYWLGGYIYEKYLK